MGVVCFRFLFFYEVRFFYLGVGKRFFKFVFLRTFFGLRCGFYYCFYYLVRGVLGDYSIGRLKEYKVRRQGGGIGRGFQRKRSVFGQRVAVGLIWVFIVIVGLFCFFVGFRFLLQRGRVSRFVFVLIVCDRSIIGMVEIKGRGFCYWGLEKRRWKLLLFFLIGFM